jgi:hypothetical protein
MTEICPKGYNYQPTNPKADGNGCVVVKDGILKEKYRENFGGTFSIYNAVRCTGVHREVDPASFIGV